MCMRLYTALYHAFMPPLYAGALYQGLYQVYATRAPLGFIPNRSYICSRLSKIIRTSVLRDVLSHEFSGLLGDLLDHDLSHGFSSASQLAASIKPA